MKKNYKLVVLTLAMMLLSTFNGIAQTYQMKPLYQVFTSSTCSGCPWGNMILDGVLSNNSGNYSLVKYQVNWPGTGDPYYVQETKARRDYYVVTAVPDLFINDTNMLPFGFNQAIFDSQAGKMTSMGITVDTAEITAAGLINIDLELEVDANYAAGLKLQVAVVERLTTGNVGNNGETEFHNVMLHMFPDGKGTVLPALTVGNNQTYSFNYDMSTTFMEQASDLRVVVFVEDTATKAIIQSEMVDVTPLFQTYTTTFTVTDCAGNIVPGAVVTYEKMGTDTADSNGEIVYERMINGTYTYEAKAAGLINTTGTVTVSSANATETAILDVPTVLYLEDFTNGVPASWGQLTKTGSGDMILEYNGTAIIYNQSAAFPPLMLATEAIDLTGAVTVSFDLGNTDPYTEPVCGFGYLTDPTDTSTYVELTEIAIGVLENAALTHEYDLSAWNLSDTVYFAFSFNRSAIGLNGGFFSVDNFKLKSSTVVENVSAYVSNYHQTTVKWDHFGACGSASAAFNEYKVYRSIEGGPFTLRDSLITNDYYHDVNLAEKSYEYYVTVTVDNIEYESSDTVSVLVTGIEDVTENSFAIYPNPATDAVTISAPVVIKNIKIYNQVGQLVLDKAINAKSFTQDISALNTGVYIIRLETSNTIISKRLIKN